MNTINVDISGITYAWTLGVWCRASIWDIGRTERAIVRSSENGKKVGDMRALRGFAFYVQRVDHSYEWRGKDKVYWQLLNAKYLVKFKKDVLP